MWLAHPGVVRTFEGRFGAGSSAYTPNFNAVLFFAISLANSTVYYYTSDLAISSVGLYASRYYPVEVGNPENDKFHFPEWPQKMNTHVHTGGSKLSGQV